MKYLRFLKTVTFWFVLFSLIANHFNRIGIDDMNILLFAFNPIMKYLIYKEPFRGMLMNESAHTFTMLCYLGNTVTSAFYGIIVDGLIMVVKRGMEKA